ncbi:hypothetical protein Efla_004244 [Eimeria flavescens]
MAHEAESPLTHVRGGCSLRRPTFIPVDSSSAPSATSSRSSAAEERQQTKSPLPAEPADTVSGSSVAQLQQLEEKRVPPQQHQQPLPQWQQKEDQMGGEVPAVFQELLEQVQQHWACMLVFRLYYEALFSCIRSLQLSERNCLPPWENVREAPWEPSSGATSQGAPQGAFQEAPLEGPPGAGFAGDSSARDSCGDAETASGDMERASSCSGPPEGVLGGPKRGVADDAQHDGGSSAGGSGVQPSHLWNELGGHPRAMVEFEMELVHRNRNRLLRTLGEALSYLEIQGAAAKGLVEKCLKLQQHLQHQRGAEGDNEPRSTVQHAAYSQDWEQQQLVLQKQVIATLTAESKLWKLAVKTARELDVEAPLLGGCPIKLLSGPHNSNMLPADYIVPTLLPLPRQTPQAPASARRNPLHQQEKLDSQPAAATTPTGAAAAANGPSGQRREGAAAAAAAAITTAADSPTAATAAMTTETAVPSALLVTAEAAAATSAAAARIGAVAAVQAIEAAAIAKLSGGGALRHQASASTTAVNDCISAEGRSARAAEAGEPFARGATDHTEAATHGVTASAPAASCESAAAQPAEAPRHEAAGEAAVLDEFAIRSFPGPTVVQDPRVRPLPSRRLQRRRRASAEAAEEEAGSLHGRRQPSGCPHEGPPWAAEGRPGYTVIRLPLWMQCQPPALPHPPSHEQQHQLQQQDLLQHQLQQQELQQQELQQQELQQQELQQQELQQQELQQRGERHRQEQQMDQQRMLEGGLQRGNSEGVFLDLRWEALDRQQGSLSADFSTANPSTVQSMLSSCPPSGNTNKESPPTDAPGKTPSSQEH